MEVKGDGTVIRKDGRTSSQLRKIDSEQALLNKADGSSKFVLGMRIKTKH